VVSEKRQKFHAKTPPTENVGASKSAKKDFRVNLAFVHFAALREMLLKTLDSSRKIAYLCLTTIRHFCRLVKRKIDKIVTRGRITTDPAEKDRSTPIQQSARIRTIRVIPA
jgi:hypothetical protein